MNHKKKMIAPIIVSILFVLYCAAIIWAIVTDMIPLWGKILAIIIGMGLAGASVYTVYERIKEIRSGVEDDLSKY